MKTINNFLLFFFTISMKTTNKQINKTVIREKLKLISLHSSLSFHPSPSGRSGRASCSPPRSASRRPRCTWPSTAPACTCSPLAPRRRPPRTRTTRSARSRRRPRSSRWWPAVWRVSFLLFFFLLFIYLLNWFSFSFILSISLRWEERLFFSTHPSLTISLSL